MSSRHRALFAATSLLVLGIHTQAVAQSKVFTTPNLTTVPGAQSVSLGGKTFTNQGLVGVGRLSAATRDFAGETLGSFSGMAMDLSSWRRASDGTYSGKMFTLPDRGPNDVGPFVGTTDYRNRVHTHTVALTPYTGPSTLPATTSSQSQLVITPTGGFLLTDTTNQPFTGKDAGSNVLTRDGIQYPSPAIGEGAGRISLDTEAIAFLPDGSFYISDEYAAGIYYFDKTGKQIGAIQTVAALLPRTAGVVSFNGAAAPTTGRRNNQGLEAIAVTADGSKLVTVLQSATVQDTGTGNQGRNNTRILIYDISKSRTPTNPIEHYVLQLPIISSAGIGGAPNATAAQSEVLALNDKQFLVLSRDGVGRGSGANAANSPVYKSVLLVDTSGATNIAGTAFENTAGGAVSPGGTLNTGITPVQQVQLVNLLNPVQLGKFGLNLKTSPSDILSLSEKWEAMGLVPVLDDSAPQDFFLLVTNDNDFVTPDGRINGQNFDASLSGAGGAGANDNLILVYRLTLPTYVDSLALSSLRASGPAAAAVTGASALRLGSGAARASFEQLQTTRRLHAATDENALGPQMWVQGGWSQSRSKGAIGIAGLDADGPDFAIGVDWSVNSKLRLGATVGRDSMQGRFGQGFGLDASALSFALYGSYGLENGFYAQGVVGAGGNIQFDEIQRPAAYGQTALGTTSATSLGVKAEVGFTRELGALKVGPYLNVETHSAEISGYTETSASVSNATFADREQNATRWGVGVEVSGNWAGLSPVARIGYVKEDTEAGLTSIRLAGAEHPMANLSLAVPTLADDFTLAEVGIAGTSMGYEWRAGLQAHLADDASAQVTFGIAKRF